MPQKFLRSALAVFFVFYIAFHTIHGEQGVYALWVESHRMDLLEKQLSEVKEERAALEHRVSLLRDQSLDPDLLDEQARRFLGVSGPDEIVVHVPEPSSPAE